LAEIPSEVKKAIGKVGIDQVILDLRLQIKVRETWMEKPVSELKSCVMDEFEGTLGASISCGHLIDDEIEMREDKLKEERLLLEKLKAMRAK